ncbi:AAA family ATPase, partial [Streptomyces sp. NPDC002920]
ELAHAQRDTAGRWMMAAARGKERARENAFVPALAQVLRNPQAGARQEFLGVPEVTACVNQIFRTAHPHQHASHSTVDGKGQAPFFRNPAHLPGLPADDLDVETLTRLRRQTRGHFETRGRGVEHASDPGDYFTGRTSALAALAAWLAAPRHDRKARVVTGNPGSGKSSLLGRFVMLADPDHPARAATASRALPPPGLPVVRLHARRALLEELAADLASAVGLGRGVDCEELLHALGERTRPLVVLVDALDEAGTAGDTAEGSRVARELLQPLSTLPAVRLVVGTRRPLIPSLGRAVVPLDLDSAAYAGPDDVGAYATALLLDAADPDSRSPYRGRPEEAAEVAAGIARRAGNSFLVARMTARALVQGQFTVDTGRPEWERELPSDAGQAFAAYLARFGRHRAKAERLLRPLAYAQGEGLPWSTVWAPLAEALSGVPCPQDDLRWLHEEAGAYLVETATASGSAYRLFHETMAEHLRDPGSEVSAHRVIASALLRQVPHDPRSGAADWSAAHPYLRDHLATHAAAGRCLDLLLHDGGFLVHAAPAQLLRALHATNSDECRLRCAVYRASAAVHASAGPRPRRDILAIDAARYAEDDLARELARGLSWRPRWATGSLVHPALHGTLAGVGPDVAAVASTTIDGRPHVLTVADGGVVHIWDLADGTLRDSLDCDAAPVLACTAIDGRPHALVALTDGPVHVRDLTDGTLRTVLDCGTALALACTVIDDRPHAVVGNTVDVRVWDLTDGTLRAALGHSGLAESLTCVTVDGRPHAVGGSSGGVSVWDLGDGSLRLSLKGAKGVRAVACTTLDDRPHAVTAGTDATVRVWDLTDGFLRTALHGHSNIINAVACVTVDDRPHAVTAGDDEVVRVWDLTDGTTRATFHGHTHAVRAVACTAVEDRPHAVTAGTDGIGRVWDLTDGTRRATLRGHTNWVRAAVCTTIDETSCVLTAGIDAVVRVWNLAAGSLRTTLHGHTSSINAVACTTLDGRPHAVTGADDDVVRVWDLTDGSLRHSLGGHTNWVQTVACATVDGRPHALTADDSPGVRVWDLTDGTTRGVLSVEGDESVVESIACTTVEGRPHAVTGGSDGAVRVWDLTDNSLRATLRGHNAWIRAVACTVIGGRPHAVTGGSDGAVRVWDLVDGTLHAALRTPAVVTDALTCTTLGGRPHAVVTGTDAAIRLWDLELQQLRDTIALPLPAGAVAAEGSSLVVGMRNEVVVLEMTPDPVPDFGQY